MQRNTGPATELALHLGESDFARVARFAWRIAGLSISESKRTMVQSRLSRRLRETGHHDFSSYMDYVEGEAGKAEIDLLISALTTNVSHFFREEHHFATLRETILPELSRRARQGERIRIWSAGCSNGQEPYTIAMSLIDGDPGLLDLDVRILATDIDLKVLAFAQNGVYDPGQLQGVSDRAKTKYFRKIETDGKAAFGVVDALKNAVSFRRLNLMDPWPMQGVFDAIFCRNVVIYFSEETQAKLWPKFAARLAPQGWFFIGHSERIQNPREFGFEPSGVTAYRKIEGTKKPGMA